MRTLSSKNIKILIIVCLAVVVFYFAFPIVSYFSAVTVLDKKMHVDCDNKDDCVWHDVMDGDVYQNNKYGYQLMTDTKPNLRQHNANESNLIPPFLENEVSRVGFLDKDNNDKETYFVKVFSLRGSLDDAISKYKKLLTENLSVSNVKQTNNSDPMWEKMREITYNLATKTYVDVLVKNNQYLAVLEILKSDQTTQYFADTSITNLASRFTAMH